MKNNTTNGPKVVAIAYDNLCTFEYGIACEIFGLSRPEMGENWYQFQTAAIEDGMLNAHGGLSFNANADFDAIANSDIVIIPGWKGMGVKVPDNLLNALKICHTNGGRLISICSGAFVLASTGLLDGKSLTSHWRYADDLRRIFPNINIDEKQLFIDEGRILTSAGSAAGIDLMLYIIKQDYGARAANMVAKRLVVSTQRNGGQAQFIDRDMPPIRSDKISQITDEIKKNPKKNWTIAKMANHSATSERTFIRKFIALYGISPFEYLINSRIEAAKMMLETKLHNLEEIAHECGFGTLDNMRHHFRRNVNLSPSQYRARFG